MTFTGEYPDDWPEIAQGVKEAAGWRCVRCGHPDPPRTDFGADRHSYRAGMHPCDDGCFGHERDGKQRVLTVHHFDNDKSNCAWWNLGALCQVCHLKTQAKIVMGQQYLWHHAWWFRVYVAGYYAHINGFELTREEVEAHMYEWLKLGQPHLSYEGTGP